MLPKNSSDKGYSEDEEESKEYN